MMNLNNELCFFLFKKRFFIAIITLFAINEGKNQVFAKEEVEYKALRRLKLLQSKPCVLLEKNIQYQDDDPQQQWVCEMHDDDIIKVNPDTPPGVSLTLDVNGLTEDDFRNNELVSGITTLMADSAEISNCCLTIPPDATKVFGRVENNSTNDGSNGEILTGRTGSIKTTDVTKKVLAVRVKTKDAVPTANAATMSNRIFGSDNVNLATQIDACSYGSMKIVPATGTSIVNGVIEIQLNIPTNGNTGAILRDAAIGKLTSIFGNLGSKFDHIMFCLPPGTTGGWLAYAYVNHWVSVYNDRWCLYPSAQLHEIGHNLNIQHANQGPNRQDDKTGVMGKSYGTEDGPEMCYNIGQSWNLGWYKNRHAVANPLEKTWNGKIVGIADYGKTNSKVILKLPLGNTDYFIGFNRKSGINIGTQEALDQVVIIEQSGFAPSNLEAILSEGGTYKISNYLGTSSDVTIEVKEINLTSNTPYAKVNVYKDNCVPGTCDPSCNSDPPKNDEIQCCTRNADCIGAHQCEIGVCNKDNICVYDNSNCNILRMELMTDNKPEETTWEIIDDCNNDEVVMSGGPYTNRLSRHVDEIYVNPSKYTVKVFDSNRDGLCCSNGLGSFTATLNDNVILSGGDFTGKKVMGSYGSCDDRTNDNLSNAATAENNNDNDDGYTTIFYENFEVGFGNGGEFEDGGYDTSIVKKVKHDGKASLRLRDDTKSSVACTKESYNISEYNTGRIKFYLRGRKLQPEKNEGFYLEYSSNHGKKWHIIQHWIVGTDFYNTGKKKNKWKDVTIDFDISNINNIKLRFRCDSHAKNRRIWIDDVTFSAQ